MHKLWIVIRVVWQDNYSLVLFRLVKWVLNVILLGLATSYECTCNYNRMNSQMLHLYCVIYVAIHEHSTFWMKKIHSVIYYTHSMVIQSHTCIDYKQVKSPLSCDEWYIFKKNVMWEMCNFLFYQIYPDKYRLLKWKKIKTIETNWKYVVSSDFWFGWKILRFIEYVKICVNTNFSRNK